MSLIIVESPTKARTFNYILKGTDHFVFASMGHIRDLPKNEIAIDFQNQFKPNFEISKNKDKVINGLLEKIKNNPEIILATDLDREGEAIAYHVAYILNLIDEKWPDIKFRDKLQVKRIVFHEITSKALKEALANPVTLRFDLVKAQFARRILDRVVGYELSPLLWKKTKKNWLSAGRVQTIALRLIVEREKEINKFSSEDYYIVNGEFGFKQQSLTAKLISKQDISFEQQYKINLFANDYTYTKSSINESNITNISTELNSDSFKVKNIDESVSAKYPMPPHTTSLLQQDAFYRYGFSSKQTMKLAQDLYERGLITYHRTDSFNLSSKFVFGAKDYIEKQFGKNYILEKPRGFFNKSKSAQEAHEAIRPTKFNDVNAAFKDSKAGKLTINHKRLYQLIFNRSIATQMKEAQIKIIKTIIESQTHHYIFESSQQTVVFDGFLKIYDSNRYIKSDDLVLLQVNDSVVLNNLETKLSKTKPPPRYNEAMLIKTLEEKGIGRPSTYAMIISLILTKNYTEKDGRYFVPTTIGTAICDYLSTKFPDLFNLNYTASMEEDLDKIANNQLNFIDLLERFYQPFKKTLEANKLDNSTLHIEDKVEGVCPKCQGNLIKRFSKFGKFIACSNYPKCRYTQSIVKTVKGKKCPQCQKDIVVKFTKSKKRFYGCSGYPECKWSAWTLANHKTQVKNNKTQIPNKK